MGVISIGELPIGPAEILQIKGSASALGRQALRNLSILFFTSAIGAPWTNAHARIVTSFVGQPGNSQNPEPTE
jgi:hypothetical protein